VPVLPPPRRLRSSLLAGAVATALTTALACSGYELKLPTSIEGTARGTSRVSALPTQAPVAAPSPERTDTPVASPAAVAVATPPLAPVPEAAPGPDAPRAPDVLEPPSALDADASPSELLATARETVVYSEPSRRGQKVGYLRLGARVRRSKTVAGYDGCAQGWYPVAPYGFVCVGNAASKDVGQPLADLARTRPDRAAPLPYAYGR